MIRNKHFNMSDKTFLIRRINDIKNKKCYQDIFRLILNQNINYTRNSNGIFFNLALLNDEILNKIDFILSFHENQIKIFM
jgi:hypothetical protein